MWRKQYQLEKMFSVSPAQVTKVCRFIDNHLDRYGKDAVIARSYSVLAFADACETYKAINDGQEVPPFDPERIKPYIAENLVEDATDFYAFGVRKTRIALYDSINAYFNETKVPRECRRVVRAIRTAVLSMIMTEEVK